MATHAKLSPSSAHRWMNCAASIIVEKDLPNTSSAHADEGTAAHFLASESLEQGKDASDFLNRFISLNGGNAYWNESAGTRTGFSVDLEMIENVQKYIDAIRSQADGNQLLVEQRLDFSEFIGAQNAFGTADAVVLTDTEIQVHDLKYGRLKVSADDNEQLKLYALGALNEYSWLGDFTQVRMVIHQPRAGGSSESVITVEELIAFAAEAKSTVKHIVYLQDVLNIGDGASIDEYKEAFNPGEKQCQWCKAKGTCLALAKHALETIIGDFDDVNEVDLEAEFQTAAANVQSAQNDLLGKFYAAAPLIKTWMDAVAREVASKLNLGEQVTGFKLVQGRQGNRAWADVEEAEQLLKSMRLKTEQMYDLKLISPTAAESLKKADAIGPRQWTKVENLITRSEGKPTVVHESDKRPALEVNPTNDFEEIQGN